MVGVILVIGRLLRLGSLIENINEATLIGVKVGLGATVALGQVPKLIGVDVTPTGHGFIRTVIATVEAIPAANLATAILSTVTIVILVVVRSVAPRVPAQLIVVAGGIVLVALTGIRNMGVDVIPRVPSGLPVPSLPDLTDAAALVPGALAVAVMAFLETASVARGIRQSGDPQVDSDRELLAVGVASIVGSFFHTLPAAGGFSQSAVMLRAGARSQVASIVTAVFAVLIALFLAPVLDFLPEATLASMVVVAVVGLIDVPAMVRLARLSRIEFWISVVVAAVGLAAGLLPAVAAGVLFTIGLVLREVNRARFTLDRDDDLLTIHLQASLYTASVFATQRAIAQAIDDGPVVPRTFVLDARQVTIASLTVIDALADFDRELAERGIRFEVSGLAGPPLALVRKTEWGSALDAAGRLSPGSGDSAQ
jgi:MFS superfamily sulfate permease-like transporter